MLRLQNLKKTFHCNTVNEKRAIGNLSLHLSKGEFVTLIGSNGAGKSTLFGLVAGSLPPDGGHVVLEGQDITRLPEHRRSKLIGRIFQDPFKGTAPRMSISENLALAHLRSGESAWLSGVGSRKRAFFREQLAALELGLEDRMDSPVGLLSGGQRQALTLLMATLVTPKLLLLDEHTAALDPTTAETVLQLTQDLVAQHGITCIMITHNITTALRLGSRTVMMDDGRVVMDIKGEQRQGMTVEMLLQFFRQRVGTTLDNDRMLLDGSGECTVTCGQNMQNFA